MSIKNDKRIRRHKKIRMIISGTKERPRLFVFRSNQHIYAQLVDDDSTKILMGVSDKEVKAKKGEKKAAYLDQLMKLSESMKITAKCGLGQSVANSFSSIVNNFKEEMIY